MKIPSLRLLLMITGKVAINFQAAFLGIILAGILTKSDFGLLQQLTAGVVIALTLTQFGLEIMAQYTIAEHKARETELALQFIYLKILMSFSALPILFLYFYATHLPSENSIHFALPIYMFAFFLAINRFITNGLLIYLDRIKLAMISLNVISLVKLCLILTLYLTSGIEVFSIILMYAVIEVLLFLYLFLAIKKRGSYRFSVGMLASKIKNNRKHAFLQFQDVILSMLVSMYGGVFIISFANDFQLIAAYTFIMSVIQAVFFGASINSVLEQFMISSILREKASSHGKVREEEIVDRIGAWAAFSIICNLVYVVFLYFGLSLLDKYWLSSRYTHEVQIICLLYVCLSFTAWQHHYNAIATVQKRIDLARNSGIFGGIAHFVLLIILVPYFGLLGAVIGFLVSCNVRWIYLHIALGKPPILTACFSNLVALGGYTTICLGTACVALMVDPTQNFLFQSLLIAFLGVVTIKCAFELRAKIGL